MLTKVDYYRARDLLIEKTKPLSTEKILLSKCSGRILAEDILALESVPPFDRSAYDGYALIAHDTENAELSHPVSFVIIEEVPAGTVSTKKVISGTVVKILTGAPVPPGADTVIPFEKTIFTPNTVTLSETVEKGAGIVRKGEDVSPGELLALKGTLIDACLMGTMAGQGIREVSVYRIPRIGIFSTGDEVVEVEDNLSAGKIRDSNSHMLMAAVEKLGFQVEYLGLAGDNNEEISALLERGLKTCDAVISTGGVSVGDYDLLPEAMESIGVDIMIRTVALKPGMAAAFGEKGCKLIYALSGNPASAFTLFYAVVLPSLRRLAGYGECLPLEFPIILSAPITKKSPCSRMLRGKLDLSTGTAKILVPIGQGNAVLSSSVGCDVMAVIPAGSGPLDAGTVLKGFLL